jgi:hypothetical protein
MVSRRLPTTEPQLWYVRLVVDRVALGVVSLGTSVLPVSCHSFCCLCYTVLILTMSLSDQLRKLPGADSRGLMPPGLLSCATLIVLTVYSRI